MDRIPEPDYRFFMEAMRNRTPGRLPLYEHHIDAGFIEKATGEPLVELLDGNTQDKQKFFRRYIGFWEKCGYDIVTFERGIPLSCPGSGCLRLHTAPVISTRNDLDSYPWEKIEDLYFEQNAEHFELFAEEMRRRPNIRAVGGPGYGIFETAEDLAGFENLCYLLYDDPEMLGDMFGRIADLYLRIWRRFLRDYAEPYCVCRMGDDLGFASQTLLPPDAIRKFVIPGYKEVIKLVHASGRPFILHSCGNIFALMEDLIDAGIDAKHSNEDKIAPFKRWTELYGDRICNLGGLDMGFLCSASPSQIKEKTRLVIEENIGCGGFGFGCGNSIADYIPLENFFAMNEAANEFRLSQQRSPSRF